MIRYVCLLLHISFLMDTQAQKVISRLEIYDLDANQRSTVYEAQAHFEAPNWSPDGSYLLFNQGGELFKFDLENKEAQKLNTDFAKACNNDHGISPDGRLIVLSNNDETMGSRIYLVSAEGGTPERVTEKGPSYWHGWSPDGNTLAYCANRNGNYDIYTISVNGGPENRLTFSQGLDDGPEYSPDGQWIYFNSVRTGRMQIWRMKSDGSEQEQLTFDEYNDWFPHVSPDGNRVVFISYIDKVDPGSHPAWKKVMIRTISPEGGKISKLFELFGGQGTINVPSWSPDSKRFAFVSYELQTD